MRRSSNSSALHSPASYIAGFSSFEQCRALRGAVKRGYMELLLGFIGFKDIKSIFVEPTLAAPADVAKTEAAAIAEAKKIAVTF